jgi:hypothetical protein
LQFHLFISGEEASNTHKGQGGPLKADLNVLTKRKILPLPGSKPRQ